MRFYLIAVFFLFFSGCIITESRNLDKGLCLKWRTFNTEKMECTGGRGVAQKLCVVRQLQVTQCAVWEFPKGVPVSKEKTK